MQVVPGQPGLGDIRAGVPATDLQCFQIFSSPESPCMQNKCLRLHSHINSVSSGMIVSFLVHKKFGSNVPMMEISFITQIRQFGNVLPNCPQIRKGEFFLMYLAT